MLSLIHICIAILLAVDAAHERGVSLRTKIAALPTPARWAAYEAVSYTHLDVYKRQVPHAAAPVRCAGPGGGAELF